MTKHFLAISDLDRQTARTLVERAKVIKDQTVRSDLLAGQILVLIFEKASTRTRLSFEAAVRHLGGQTIFMTPAESQLGRAEPLRDTARVISRYGQGMIVRTFGQDKLEELKAYGSVPVVNALSDSYHPCQVMSDLLTMYERTPDLDSLRVAWVGDGNNMANSWINAARVYDFELTLACPEGYEPDQQVWDAALATGARIRLTRAPREAVAGADYVNTDVWASMGQEAEAKARQKAFAGYLVDDELLALAAPTVKVMHCLPAHRGEEITDAVMESDRAIVWDQAENRMHMQQAILEWIYS